MLNRVARNYPEDALTSMPGLDVISRNDAHTLDELFRERVRRSPEHIAYSQFNSNAQKWTPITWSAMAAQVERWQVAFREQGLVKGDRVAICYKNSIEWVVFDQAALRLGLVVVPLYTADRTDNMAFVLADSRSKLALFENAEVWRAVSESDEDISSIDTVLVIDADTGLRDYYDQKLISVAQWLPEQGQHFERGINQANDLASIVYTSGTTGKPKGVMLSHQNMLANAHASLRSVALKPSDRALSFLPLSHTLERTIGYYGTMMAGASVYFNRSIPELADDLSYVAPTVMVSVPRIFERIHNQIYLKLDAASWLERRLFYMAVSTGWQQFLRQQGVCGWHPRLLVAGLLDRIVARKVQQLLGGQLEKVLVGGAPLSAEVTKTFISLGIPLLQGYGLTETSPVVSVNTLRRNRPDSIGLPLRGVEVKLMDNDELWVKGEAVMQGYWGRAEDTAATMHGEWLKSGDRASIDEEGYIRIIGRIKDILVLENGEKVPPPDLEARILRDPLFEQAMVLGEGKAFLSCLLVMDSQQWQTLCTEQGVDPAAINSDAAQLVLLERISSQMHEFPSYAQIRRVYASLDQWTVEDGLLTPTLKMKRNNLLAHFKTQVANMYVGHGVHRT